MKSTKDKFSSQAKIYKKYRPTYPKEIYQELMELTEDKNECWDCGTGNGQVATQLAKYFKKVYATDISQKQLDNAEKLNNIIYKVERAEKTNFSDSKFDLITVAQAIHWFDFKSFNKEVKRVGKHGGLISIWGYGLLRINPELDELIDKFYYDIIGPFWNEERKHVDNAYESVQFDFEEVPVDKNKSITTNWGLKELEGYFNSWSSVQNFKKVNPKIDPVNQIMQEVEERWSSSEVKEIKFPIFMKVGRIEK